MSKLINLTGQRFGFWLVKSRTANNKSGQTQWLCQCDCGIERLVTANSLRTGNSTSCGCNHTPDLTGIIFDGLTVIQLDVTRNGRRYWLCKCACSNLIVITTNQLRGGLISSCGCLNKIAELDSSLKTIIADAIQNAVNALVLARDLKE